MPFRTRFSLRWPGATGMQQYGCQVPAEGRENSSVRRLMRRRGGRRAGREHPEQDVQDDAEPAGEREQDERDADEHRVDVEPFAEAAADTGDLAVGARETQAAH